jgi:hypothetical protein
MDYPAPTFPTYRVHPQLLPPVSGTTFVVGVLADNVAVLSALPKCGRCRWFVDFSGECHRHSPAANSRPGDGRTRIFPVVDIDESCGDFQEVTCPR